MTFYWHDWAGYLGVVLILLAYLMMQAHRLSGNGLAYQLMNTLGALGVILSLAFGFGPINWPAFLLELAWVIIGVFGIVHGSRRRRNARDAVRDSEQLPPMH